VRFRIEGISAAYLFTIWRGGGLIALQIEWRVRAILRDLICAASQSEPPFFMNLRRGLRIKFSGCLSAASYAAFETRLKQCSVTRCHSATTVG